MKVYVVEFGEYSDHNVVGVYSSSEAAAIVAGRDGKATEFELDDGIGMYHAGMRSYRVLMAENGDVIKVECLGYSPTLEPVYQIGFSYPEGKRPATIHFEGTLWVKTEKQAIKATNEQRAKAIASGEWDRAQAKQRQVDSYYAELERKANEKL